MRVLFFLLFLVATLPIGAFAHPGNTASDGCHYCRTNCASWGEIYGARHCHGSGYVAPARTYTPPTQKVETTVKPSTEIKSNFNPEDYYAPTVSAAPEEDDDGWWFIWLFMIGGGGFFLVNRLRRGKRIQEQEDKILQEEKAVKDIDTTPATFSRDNLYADDNTFDYLDSDYDDEVRGIADRNDLDYDEAEEVQEIMDDYGIDEDDAIMIKEEL